MVEAFFPPVIKNWHPSKKILFFFVTYFESVLEETHSFLKSTNDSRNVGMQKKQNITGGREE